MNSELQPKRWKERYSSIRSDPCRPQNLEGLLNSAPQFLSGHQHSIAVWLTNEQVRRAFLEKDVQLIVGWVGGSP